MIDVLIDTNMLIYAMDKTSIHHDLASQVLLHPDHNLFTTTKNISEFFAVTSKLDIAHQRSMDFYQDLKAQTIILFPSEKSLTIFEDLINQYTPKGNLVYDIEIVSIMLANDIDTVATLNLKDFIHINEIKILNNH